MVCTYRMGDKEKDKTRLKVGTRDSLGRFLPGNTDSVGNSGGGRLPLVRHIRELAREQTQPAFEALLLIAMRGESETARVTALKEIFDRGWGKSTQFYDTPEKSNLSAMLAVLFGGQHVLEAIRDGDDAESSE